MRNTDYFKDKKVAIVGLARSGFACANLLYSLGSQVAVTEGADNQSVRALAGELKSKNISVETGGHSPDFIRDKDIVVISPGVPPEADPVAWARQNNIPVISEIEVGFMLCPAAIIAVTGTNGKTTVTTLIGKILEEDKRPSYVCGNIGDPFCGQVGEMRKDGFVSLEVSSFQLEGIDTFRPKISVILNLGRNHLDRYEGMEAYLAAKKRIFMNQDEGDYLVLNYDDETVRGLAKESRAKVVYFSKDNLFNLNQSAVMAVGSILAIEREKILKVFAGFTGVQHRMEYAGSINGVDFINDSKATTVDAAVWALKNIPSAVVLIAGGREKGNDYGQIRDLIRRKVKQVVLIGEAKDGIKKALGGILAVSEAPSLEEAVKIAFAGAASGDCVLFSPMCKSFDMFSDYEERGRVFKETVNKLKLATSQGTIKLWSVTSD